MGSKLEFMGDKGGGSSHTPVESPNSLRSIQTFRIVDLISEGECAGLVNGLQSVYLDGTPVANADGSLNFTGVHVVQRTGTQTQDVIPGFSAVENEVGVGVELRSDTPWVVALSNTSLSAVRVTLETEGQQKTNTSNGDVTGLSIAFAIDVATDGGAYNTVATPTFDGKSTSQYQRSIRVDLPAAATGWNIRVRRTTANQDSATVADTSKVSSYTEIIDAKLRYPNSALIAITGDASQSSNVPARSYDWFGLIVKVPSNYDPTDRTYTGVWDGTFKPAWTNNPAWVLYDLILNNRYGLGDLIDASQVDKWSLYEIGQYCDQLVDDGKGGQEPRYTINTQLQSKADAYRVLGDMASVFRGIAYWDGQSLSCTADMPGDPVYTYSASNVIDGKFTYQSSARKTRYTTAQVTWNDPGNAYAQAIEPYEDDAGIARYGIQPTEFVAFGCTSQGQARRAAKWAALTSRLETESVTFQVGMDGYLAAPGQKINVQDPKRAGARQSGRISSATATIVTVDRAPDQIAAGDTLTVNMPDGSSQSRPISSISGRSITVSTAFSTAPAAQSVWLVTSATLAAQTFRVLNVKNDSADGKIAFTITALQHVADKFAAVESGTIIQVPPISKLPTPVQPPVTSVTITSHQVIVQGTAATVLTISWVPPAGGAARYRVEWQRNNGAWSSMDTITTTLEQIGVYTGTYVARVTAVNAAGIASVPVLSIATPILGKTVPPTPPTLTAVGGKLQILLTWQFPTDINVDDTSYTEIWVSETSTLAEGESFGFYAYPINTCTITGLLPEQRRYAWARMVDKSGNVGEWSVPVSAVGGDLTDLFKPVQDQIDALLENNFPRFAGSASDFIGDTTVYAGVWSETTIRQERDNEFSQTLSLIGAAQEGNRAFVLNAATVQLTPGESLADSVNSVRAEVSGLGDDVGVLSASVSTVASAQASTDGKVNASYTLLIDANGYVSGFVSQNDGSTANFVVVADNFQIIKPGGGARTEFSSANWRIYSSSGALRARWGVW